MGISQPLSLLIAAKAGIAQCFFFMSVSTETPQQGNETNTKEGYKILTNSKADLKDRKPEENRKIYWNY
jgi:hypothetical protein